MTRFTPLLLVLLCRPGFGQPATGIVRGFVSDTSWNLIQGAAVEARNAQTRVSYRGLSAGNGSFAISGLPPGQYSVTIAARGMRAYSHAYVSVQGDSIVEEDVQLEIDPRPDFSDPQVQPVPILLGASARDLFDQDGEFSLNSPALLLNGNGLDLPASLSAVQGKLLWIYLPGHGRYWLSAAPRKELGFELKGQVQGTKLQFLIGEDVVQVDSADRIVAGSAVYNLYVLGQPGWSPREAKARLNPLLGAADHIELSVERAR